MGSSSALSGLPPLPPGATLTGASPSGGSGLPPLPNGAKLNSAPPQQQTTSQTLTQLDDMTANLKGEGLYAMHSPDGRQVQIPYSKVHGAIGKNYLFNDKKTLQQYARDLGADPLSEDRVNQFLDKHPVIGAPLSVLMGIGGAAMKTATAFDRAPHTQGEQSAQLAAATPPHGVAQGLGDLGENVGEFFTGEELMGLVGKALPAAERLKAASQMGKLLEQHPVLAKLVKIGSTAVKQGTIAGGQTFVKTGGDTEAARRAAEETALTMGATEGVLGPVARLAARVVKPAEAAAGASEYAATARAAAEPHLRAVSDAIENARGAAAEGESALQPRNALAQIEEQVTGKKPPVLNVDQVLNRVHDFTGAADRLAEVNNAGYEALDKITGGRFRALNTEVAAAQKSAYRGEEGAEGVYHNKLAEMESLIDQTKGVTPETLQALKSSWRQSYQLRDFGNMWDRNLNGVPGSSNVSAQQRGVNGRGLMKDLQRAVRVFGRPQIENAIGAERLDNLENIARLNTTNAQRAKFNAALSETARYLPVAIGGHVAGLPGMVAGGVIGAMSKPTMERVLNAVRTNPRIGQFLTHAVEYGADPKNYGPMIATMIQKAETEQSASEHEEKGDEQ